MSNDGGVDGYDSPVAPVYLRMESLHTHRRKDTIFFQKTGVQTWIIYIFSQRACTHRAGGHPYAKSMRDSHGSVRSCHLGILKKSLLQAMS